MGRRQYKQYSNQCDEEQGRNYVSEGERTVGVLPVAQCNDQRSQHRRASRRTHVVSCAAGSVQPKATIAPRNGGVPSDPMGPRSSLRSPSHESLPPTARARPRPPPSRRARSCLAGGGVVALVRWLVGGSRRTLPPHTDRLDYLVEGKEEGGWYCRLSRLSLSLALTHSL